MSYAADNPELYDAICNLGIVEYILTKIPELKEFEEELLLVLESIQDGNFDAVLVLRERLYDKLIELSGKEISENEADHFGSIADAVAQQYPDI